VHCAQALFEISNPTARAPATPTVRFAVRDIVRPSRDHKRPRGAQPAPHEADATCPKGEPASIWERQLWMVWRRHVSALQHMEDTSPTDERKPTFPHRNHGKRPRALGARGRLSTANPQVTATSWELLRAEPD
jgi:hypothetical protein